ncbi:T9SS C-terminal target domain-containing protein [Flavobacterium sp. SM2513]|uniref:T9SS C-terminal target domain-containing protein n=1 Tax=Flavobacterium sp. SM2513 TaxID=3424766 RepID=UPI003D7FE008
MKLFWALLFLIFNSDFVAAQIVGCTDVEAKNYNPNAIINDGSCRYRRTKVKPLFSIPISDTIHETSGLLFWNEKLWTMNDDRDRNLYSLDTTGINLRKFSLAKVINKDWEAISQDSSHLYIGDFGNNVSGNRRDLHILKIEKKALLENRTVIDTIAFSFEKQNNFTSQKANTTNFDCETILVTKDSLYLLTKEWSSKKTRLYVLPKVTGMHQARYKATLEVNGLVTGGVILEDKRIIALCGYSKKLKPFLYLLYDYDENDFFSGNKRKIKLALPFFQIEGIATKDGLNYFLTNESFQRKPFISVNQQLHSVNLGIYLKSYVSKSIN